LSTGTEKWNKTKVFFRERHPGLSLLALGIVLAVAGYLVVNDHYGSDAHQGKCRLHRAKGAGQTGTAAGPAVAPSAANKPARGKTASKANKGAANAKKRTLQSPDPIRPINVTGTQGIAKAEITLAASPALPRRITPEMIRVQIPQDPRRVDEKSSTQYLPTPKHSLPKIIERRHVIRFDVCSNLRKESVPGGAYAGQVVATAPGYDSGVVTLTVNVKDSDWFVKVFYGAIVLAFALLLIQAAQTGWNAETDSTRRTYRKAFLTTIKDVFGFWLTTFVAIGAVFAATWGVYAADPSWGADHIGSLIGLVGTAVAAAGLGNLLAPAKPK
jgi:hypothetical protein